jgi:hypothetical protein
LPEDKAFTTNALKAGRTLTAEPVNCGFCSEILNHQWWLAALARMRLTTTEVCQLYVTS